MNNNINMTLGKKNYTTEELENAQFFRGLALAIDADPVEIFQYKKHPVIKRLASIKTESCESRVRLLESLAYGDIGVYGACPNPFLAGAVIQEIGNAAQQDHFFHFIEKNIVTSFFAVTEPNKGSDAGNMETYIEKVDSKHYKIFGHKWLIGHGADAPIGVVIARLLPGPLGVVGVLINPTTIENAGDTLIREHLPMIGLRGLRISRLRFNGLVIDQDDILGYDLSPLKRGMMTLIRAFKKIRPGNAALAIGFSQAVIDYVKTNFALSVEASNMLNLLNQEVMALRLLNYKIARETDLNNFDCAYDSIVKAKSSWVAEKVMSTVIAKIGVTHLQHPLLLKWQRDAYGFEYMEGTSHIHLLHVYNAFVHDKFNDKKYSGK